ncbi:MAG: 3-phosphoshikimate 1-carboxyvinyltransferase [Actinobacteria bacterium]|nr:3-phosphoshikimate 1-carboxyvinyltransferase [Actinomycetota bacterium]
MPGDKSVSHRAVMLGSIAEGDTIIKNFLTGEDCLATMNCFKELGVKFEGPFGEDLLVHGKGLRGLSEPSGILDAANSGTTMRLIMGILSGQPFLSVITGDQSLVRRPMGRVVAPLAEMGASIMGRNENTLAPLAIRGGKLRPIDYISPVASAQVKSAVLLAGLYTGGKTTVTEPAKSRDHTERMLRHFGAAVETAGNTVSVYGGPTLRGAEINVPGDISSAAFLMVAAAVVPGSELVIENVGTNPTRDGIISALKSMGADITLFNSREMNGEPVSDIRVRHSRLKGAVLEGNLIPKMIDEIPAIAVAACAATGETVVRDAAELKVKESDRISAIVSGLRNMGVNIAGMPDGFIIRPGNRLKGAEVETGKDHRIAMAMAVAGLMAEGETVIKDYDCVNISFPGFYDVLKSIAKE